MEFEGFKIDNVEENASGKKDKKKPVKEKKERPGLKKILKTAGLGIVFGVFASGTLYIFATFMGIDLGARPYISRPRANKSVATTTMFGTGGVVETAENRSPVNSTGNGTSITAETTAVVTDVTDVVEKKMPSIVAIDNTAYYEYYGQEATSSGSGVIIGQNDSNELLIVTNNHVVEDNDSLSITFYDGAKAAGYIKGTDKSMDLAVVSVKLDDISVDTLNAIEFATLGDSSNLKVGEPVIAIGNSLGYGQSVTTGVVSALDRKIANNDANGTFIQTDAAINPGNSGGALMNITGEVIGINSNKIGGASVEGMGYAIPINRAWPVIEELLAQDTRIKVGDDEAAYFGVSGTTVTDAEIEEYDYPASVYVVSVFDDSPAAEAGIKNGDFIEEFDGKKVSSYDELRDLIETYKGDTEVKVKVFREESNGKYKEKTFKVTLGFAKDH